MVTGPGVVGMDSSSTDDCEAFDARRRAMERKPGGLILVQRRAWRDGKGTVSLRVGSWTRSGLLVADMGCCELGSEVEVMDDESFGPLPIPEAHLACHLMKPFCDDGEALQDENATLCPRFKRDYLVSLGLCSKYDLPIMPRSRLTG